MNARTSLLFLLLICVNIGFSQVEIAPEGIGSYEFNPDKIPCLTPDQSEQIHEEIQSSLSALRASNRLAYSESQRGNNPLFIWPVQKAEGSIYNSVWGVSNYLDHNANGPNLLLDYNCGTRTYDTQSGYDHQGLDIYLWPFTWTMMDDGVAEIVAAAAGQIIFKSDGNFDRSCDFSNTNPWNAVYIQHSDGSIAWYGHMKNGSTTSKNVGDMVAQGEYLGTIGSSGISTGPHLHFEVYDGENQLIDPYAGTCNSLNSQSWWASQKPYLNPGINAVFTQTAPTDFSSCPNQENTFLSSSFGTEDTIYFMAYLRDQIGGSTGNFSIIRPDNTVLDSWDYTFNTNFYSSWIYWSYSGVFSMNGTYKWVVTYADETVSHLFEVSETLDLNEASIDPIKVFPNPVRDLLNISSKVPIEKIHLTTVLGKTVFKLEGQSANIEQINTSDLSNGIYFLKLESNKNSSKVYKLIKE